MPSIYSLTTDIQELESLLEEELDELPPADEVRQSNLTFYLTTAEEQFAEKLDAYVAVYRDLQAVAKAQKEEAKHLTAMARANENQMNQLKEAVKFASEQLGRSKLRGNAHTITVSTSDSRLAVGIHDEELVPMDYKEQVTSWKIDKKAIADHTLKTGEIVDGTSVRKVTTVRFR